MDLNRTKLYFTLFKFFHRLLYQFIMVKPREKRSNVAILTAYEAVKKLKLSVNRAAKI